MNHQTLFLFLLLLLLSRSESVTFNCTGKTPTCQSLVSYIPINNNTTYASILSLFQIPNLSILLSSNNLPLSTLPTRPIPPNSPIRVPIPCSCSAGAGRSDHTPIYTVKPTDNGLDDIARLTFELLISFQEIAQANNILPPYKINSGQKLWIPLPCSCDEVDGEEVVHLAHLVEPGSTIDLIADRFGTKPDTLLRLNGISDPRKLEAGQAIDVPLRACSSSISSTSLDSNLLIPNDSYALTASNCIQCSCSSASGYQLSCQSTEGLAKFCPALVKCDNQLPLGNTSATNSNCEQSVCAYAGYTKATGSSPKPNILTKIINQSLTCNNDGVPVPSPAPSPSAGGAASTPGEPSSPGGSNNNRQTVLRGNWMLMFMSIIVALIGSSHRG